nr:hypothetical protein [Cyanobacteriota bacterium]
MDDIAEGRRKKEEGRRLYFVVLDISEIKGIQQLIVEQLASWVETAGFS